MQYKYTKERPDYSDLASGRVLYSLPGHPAFPVRLASEIFQRCMAIRGDSSPYVLYDPCCGVAYHLSVLGFLHGDLIQEIIASDVDEKSGSLAKQNLGLLTPAGLDRRIDQISELLRQYGKESHAEALASAKKLKSLLPSAKLKMKTFQASALDGKAMLENIKPNSVDLVLTDVPYGQGSSWERAEGSLNPLWSMLEALRGVLSPSSVAAIISDKGQKAAHENYQRVEHFQVGKRRVTILKLL
jgi:23S rRNA (guanine2535-N1)-methyltransferase